MNIKLFIQLFILFSSALHTQTRYVDEVFDEIYIDEDEDGIIDDPAVESALRNSDAMMPIFNSEWSSGQDNVFDYYNGCLGAVLY